MHKGAHVAANGLNERVRLLDFGLSDRDGEIEVSIGNSSATGFPVDPLDTRTTERVRLRRLDDVSDELGIERADLLKLDIEGVEVDVLEEAAAAGKLEQVDQIVMEYHHHVAPGEDRLGTMLATLERHGFGYQVLARPVVPFQRGEFCSMFVYAYQKRPRPAISRDAGG